MLTIREMKIKAVEPDVVEGVTSSGADVVLPRECFSIVPTVGQTYRIKVDGPQPAKWHGFPANDRADEAR